MNSQPMLPLLSVADGMAFYFGREITTSVHKHHAIEIVLSIGKSFYIKGFANDPQESECCIISADFPHSFIGQNDYYLFIYLDPELSFARQLEDQLSISGNGLLHYKGQEISLARDQIIKRLESHNLDTPQLDIIVTSLLNTLIEKPNQVRSIDDRIQQAIELVRGSLMEEIKLEKIASGIFLSPSRFAHLFKQQTGIPFRRYVLWFRIQAASKAVITGQNLTQAAYEGGFSDVAHFSRTFSEMFGIAPSEVLKK